MATLIKIDRNGSKHYEGLITCDRCGGRGLYIVRVENNRPIPTIVDNGVCHKCWGTGKVHGKWIERTPEYQAKLDARRAAKWAALEAKAAEERAKREEAERIEAERKAAEEAARKAISQHVGTVGERIELEVEYQRSARFDVKSFIGYGTSTMYVHTFKDAAGNVLVWKTSSGLQLEEGAKVTLKGTVKEHNEYKGEKQTVLTRCNIK